ncbi:MAG: hypothetical protein KJ757_07920, partial [Planctomycetes bacterium]|nr:hypothetical protein [Planctomycetota bacterium]MBU1517596.1 hypothetical protein [Planctomycetota bacterium]MBU2457130.1 hypothetical protein [Planctomycetota bacterium]MBU2597469.1 hypothetical protein [Planctomycetota bacterium]
MDKALRLAQKLALSKAVALDTKGYDLSENSLKQTVLIRVWKPLCSCMLTTVMVNNSLIGKAGAGEASVASRASTSRRREFGRDLVSKA